MAVESLGNKVDIAIIGGGIAGLWTLARLHREGYQAILVEADSLGCQQSGASQGIIHGGTKYALTGKLTHSAQSITDMPQRWKACLEGRGEVDLTQAKLLSKHQYLWSNKSLAAKLTGFFASKVMTSRMQRLSVEDHVAPFNQSGFNGELYQLDEPVLDIQSVVETLRKQFVDSIFQFSVKQIKKLSAADSRYQLQSSNNDSIVARAVILTAGAGNEQLLSSLHFKQPKMQRRPLFMPMLKGDSSVLSKMYAHCLGASALPKMTITAHSLAGEQIAWYLGGEIAEKGVGRSKIEQIKAARSELQRLMPWIDFSQCRWSALAIDRAEPLMADGNRPAEPAVFSQQQVITAWPVKLAMTPLMVDKILTAIEQLKITKKEQTRLMLHSAALKTGLLPWQREEHWL